jgi:hypothetical protein
MLMFQFEAAIPFLVHSIARASFRVSGGVVNRRAENVGYSAEESNVVAVEEHV